MTPLFKTLPEFYVIGLAKPFISILSPEKNNHKVIPQLWNQFFTQHHLIQNKTNQNFLGICSPRENNLKTHPDECMYLACCEVSDLKNVPPEMVSKIIPETEYAVFTHKGSLQLLDHTMNYIYGAWLPQ